MTPRRRSITKKGAPITSGLSHTATGCGASG
jgi:hypothetical protein